MKPRSGDLWSEWPPPDRIEEHPHPVFKCLFPPLAVYIHDQPTKADKLGLGRVCFACLLGPCYTMLCWRPKKGGRSGWTDKDPPTLVCTLASVVFLIFFLTGLIFFAGHTHSPSTGLIRRPMFGLRFHPFTQVDGMDTTSNRIAEEHKTIPGGESQGLVRGLDEAGAQGDNRYAGYGSFLDKKRRALKSIRRRAPMMARSIEKPAVAAHVEEAVHSELVTPADIFSQGGRVGR